MNTAVYNEYGPPSVLSIQQVEKPVPNDHEVLIRVPGTTVNRMDSAMPISIYR